MCFQRSSERIEGESRPPKARWKVIPQSRTGSRETPVAKCVVCSWHDQLPDVVGMRPQRATTSIREKMTVVSKVRGSSISERLMHEPRDLKRDSLTNWQPVQLPQHWCDVVTRVRCIGVGSFHMSIFFFVRQVQLLCWIDIGPRFRWNLTTTTTTNCDIGPYRTSSALKKFSGR